ncbi:hypothetical protein BC827DRAFT_1171481, partial [Russula dissimulans]
MSLTSRILLFLMALLTQIRIVDRDSAAGNLSCDYERLNRRKRGGTSQVQVEWRSGNDGNTNTSLPPFPLLASADNSRAEAMLGTSVPIHFLHASKLAQQSSDCGVIATSSQIGFASTSSRSTRDTSTESCLHVRVSRVICRT